MFSFLINIFIKIFLRNYLKKKLKLDYIILYYHRVLEDKDFNKIIGPNKELSIKKSDFIKQMNFIKKNCHPISIADIKKNIKTKKTKIIVTFDDGYKDNLKIAYPILKKNNIPFTIYIISRIVKGDTWVWWFELWEYLFFKNNFSHFFETVKNFHKIKENLYKMDLKQQKDFFKKMTGRIQRPNYKDLFLNYKDIKKLNNDPLCTIGSHTHDHLSLKSNKKNNIKKEISYSKKILENQLNTKVNYFAYPYGHYNSAGIKLLKKYRYINAVTTEYHNNSNSVYLLPRIAIGHNINLAAFERKILGFDTFVKIFILTNKLKQHAQS
jgi:peptidoglycan/xylan/chitin deacetylase (PgdA/CDA1 family)